ncbi:hypothetical protein GCM10027400_09050 [Pseudoxanthomonas daejeonensis]
MALLATWGALPAAALAANNITLTERSPGVTDTATTITPRGGNPNVTDIKTTTVRGNTGFNSFGHFEVDTGNTVNLYVPGGASNLVNLVHNSAPTINGTLNGLLESSGKIGGNIFFASSHGFVVGGSGVINVGSLLVTTPSSSKMQDLLKVANGTDTVDNNQLVLDLLAGKYDGGSAGATVNGVINSAGRVDLFAASAVVAATGAVNAGAKVFDAAVNTDGSLDVSAAVRKDGTLRIVADNTVEISGGLRALMEDNSGAVVQVAAAKGIELKGSGRIDTRAATAGLDGGDVTLEAPTIKLLETSAVVTSASGNGSAGDITFNAYSDVSCSFCNGDAGDTQTIEDLADSLKTQASPLLQAKLGKAEVVIAAGAALDAGHTGAGTGEAGDVSVQAFAFDRQMAGFAEATSSIKVDGSITGRDITLRAASDAHVSAGILNSLLNTGDLASDVSNLVGSIGEEAAWTQLFETLQESVDYQRVTDLDLLGLDPNTFSELTVLLPYVSVLIARANADVTVSSTAVLDASRNLDLQADSTRLVQASTFSLPIVNKKMPFNFGLAYGRIDGTTKVDVQSGAELNAGGNLGIRALSNDTLDVMATSVNNHDAAGNTLTTMGIAFSMAHSDITTEALVAKGAELDVDGNVAVAALTEQNLSNSADFKAIGDGATGGPAIALTLFNSKTRAVFDANLSGATDLAVSATNLVHSQSNSAAVQVGKNALNHLKKQVMGSSQVKGVTDALTNKVKSLFGMKPSAEKEKPPTESKFRLASALAIGISDHQAEAIIGSGNTAPDIDIAGNLSLQAMQRQSSMHNSADSTVNADAEKDDGSKTSISVAAAYDQINQQTRAIVGDGSSLSAARIGVGARNEQLLDLGDITRWSSVSDIFGNLKTIAGGLPEIPGSISTSYANSTSEAQDLGMAGSFAVSYHALDATAWVGDNVSLTSTASDGSAWSSKPLLGLAPFYDDQGDPEEAREELRNLQWDWDASLAVQADTLVEQLSIAGNLWWTLFTVGADGDDGKAVGGGINVQVATNRSVAGIGANGTVESEKVDVSAHQDELFIGISPSAGKGTSAAGNGAVVVGVVDANVNASIHQSTAVTAGQVGVSAQHDIGLWSAAGALAVSQETSIGIGAAVNVLTSDVEALVGDNNGRDDDGINLWRPESLGDGANGGNANWNVDEMLVDAKSTGQNGAFGIAGALARSEQEQQKQDEATEEDGGGDKGPMSILSEEGLKVLGKYALGQAGLYDGLATAVDYGTKIKDALTATPDKVAGQLEGGKDAQKPENQIAGAGSASINVAGQNTRAIVSGITLDPRTAGTGSDVTVLALNQTNQFSGAGAGALTLASGPKSDRSSAVAGAIAYNHLFNETEALVDGVTFNNSDSLVVQAASAGDQIAMGLGLAVSTGGTNNTAVAISASGGAITNTTRAAVVDSEVNQRDDAGSTQTIEVSAYDRARVLLGGGSFAGTSGSGTSAGGSLVIGYLGNKLQAEWLGSEAHGFDQFGVGAFSATRVLAGAIAGAVSVGSDSTAGSGSMFVLIVDNEVSAKVDKSDDNDHSVLEGGDVEVLAKSVSGFSALDAQFDSASTSALSSSGLDLDGSSTVAGIEVEQSTDDSLFGGDDDTSTNHSLFDGVPAGEAILGIAGSLSLSNGKAVGVSAGGIYTGSDYTASVANTDVTLDGDLDVHALNSTEALAAAVSGAIGNGDSATSGSITAIIARGTVTATVDMTGRSKALEADNLDVTATKGGGAYSLAGNITGSAGAKSVGGAFSINDMEQGTRAEVKGGTYDLGGDATIGAAQQSHVITAALSGSVSLSDLAIGGAGTFNRIADTTTAALTDATLDARNLSVTASQPGLGAQIWSLAFNLSASGGASAVGGAVAINLIDAERSAKVSGSTVNLTGDATLASSLDGEIWGFAVDATGGSGNGVGGSIVVNNIDGSDTVLVEDSDISTTKADGELKLDASAGNGLMIASLTGSIKGGGGNAVGGAVSVNRIGADRSALIQNDAANTISGFGDVSLLAGADQDIYAIAVAGGGAGNVAVNGSSTSNILEGTERAAVEGGSIDAGSLKVSAAEGDRTIWSLGGAVSGAGSVAIGVANANNIILAKRQAEVSGASLTLDGTLEIESGGAAHIRSAAVGGGGGGSFAGGASIAINVIEGEESAALTGSTVHSADSVSVTATRGDADIKTLAGNVQGGGSAAVGGAVAISTIGQKRDAKITGSTLEIGSGAIDVLASTSGRIDTLAVAGAGAGAGAGAFSNASNNIAARTGAVVQNSGGTAGNVTVRATDDSEINAISGGVAVAGGAGAGAGTAINRIESKIEAALTGTRGAGWKVTNLAVDADSSSDILSVAVGGGGGSGAGVGAAVATNLITTSSKAHVSDGAKVVAQHNIGISASNHDAILGIGAGIAGAGSVAVGASVTVNLIETRTEAYISGATTEVSALGLSSSDTMTIDSGELLNAPLDDREWFDKSTVEGDHGDDEEWVGGDLFNPAPNLGIGQRTFTGLAVQASSLQQVGQLSLAAAISVVPLGGASVAGLFNTSVLGGATEAYIDSAKINQAAGAGSAQDVHVGAASHGFSASYEASLGVSAGWAGVGAGVDVLVNQRTTRASVSGATLDSVGDTTVQAESTQYASSVVAAAGGGVVGAAAAAQISILKGTTEALVGGGSQLDVGSLDVDASALQVIAPNVATLAAGVGALGAGFGMVYNQSTTRAWVGEPIGTDGSAINTRIDAGGVDISADNTTRLQMLGVGVAGGGAAIAGTATIAIIETETEAGASQADFGSSGNRIDHLDIDASDRLKANTTVGSAAAGALSVGASANVLVANSATRAVLDNSSVYASGDVGVDANRTTDVTMNTVTGSGGTGVALGGSIGLLVLGSGASTQVSEEGESFDPMGELNKGGNGTLSKLDGIGDDDRVGDITYEDYVYNTATKEYERVERTDATAKTKLNSSSKATGSDRLQASAPASYKHETVARINGSTVVTSGDAGVNATDRLESSNLAGNVAVGGLAGVGIGMGLTFSNAQVKAEVLGGSLDANDVSVSAQSLDLGAAPAVTVKAESGAAGGFVGAGAAVAVAVVDNRVSTTLGGNIDASGTLTGRARDAQDIRVEALGANVGGAAGAGLVIGVAKHDSEVSLDVAPGVSLEGARIDLASISESAVSLVGRGGSGGILAGVNATIMVASDDSDSRLTVGENAEVLAGGTLLLSAEARPHVDIFSAGVAIGGLLSAGGTVAVADNTANATLDLRSGAHLAARDATLASRIGLNAGRNSAGVEAYGVSGGAGVAVNAVVATAKNESSSSLTSASDVVFEGKGGKWDLVASTDTRQRAWTTGRAGGLVTLGAHVSDATANATTEALVNGLFTGSYAGMNVSASAAVDNLAEASAGQGGLVSGAASSASTRDDSITRAELYARGQGSDAARLGDLTLTALHQSTFNAFVDSTSAAVLGMSGSWAKNTIDLDTHARLLGGSDVIAKSYNQDARNKAIKNASASYNVQSGSGGIFDAAAASSVSELYLDAQSTIGDNVDLALSGDWRNPQKLVVQAYNDVYARDRVKLDSGGAIAIADAESRVDVKQADAKVSVGNGSDLYSIGDLVLSASGRYDIETSTNAKTWGLAGAAMGDSLAKVDANYIVDVGDVDLFAYGDLKFLAGFDAAGAMNKATLVARTDLWNNTAFPVVNDPEAVAWYQRDSSVNLASTSAGRAVGDVYAYAGTGYSVLTGEGVGKDLYREGIGKALGLSLDITGGDTINGGLAVVTANGSLDAGVYSQRHLRVSGLKYFIDGVEVTDLGSIDANTTGTLTVRPIIDASEDVTWSVREGNYSQLISDRIEELQRRLSDYGLSPIEKSGFQAELNLLTRTLDKLYADMGGTPGSGVSLPSQLKVWLLQVDPILARPGNIHVKGDALVGQGSLSAPGDAKIEIANASSLFLDIKGLEIPDREGGQVLFNGAKMRNNAEINAANRPGLLANFGSIETSDNSPPPVISIINSYNPATGQVDGSGLKAPAPDIYVNGRISNRRGSIDLTASYGSIYANADIRGQSLNISAGKDFVLNNMDGFTHIGGDPAYNNTGGTLNPANSATVAGNNVVITALYLNINGLVQSGVADWSVVIDESAFNNLANLRAAWKAGGASVVQLATTDARLGRIGYSYDFKSESIVLDQVDIGGGYMELTGHILSTGNGQLRVLDGYSQVKVVNNTIRDLTISGIDLGNGVQGQLRINDLARKAGDDRAWSTIYTYDNGQVQRYEGWSSEIRVADPFKVGSSAGRTAQYDVTDGRTYVWLQGRDRTDTRTKVEYWDEFWGFIPTGDGTELSNVTVKGDSKPIDGAEYMGNANHAYKVDKFTIDLQVLALRLAGRNAEADALANAYQRAIKGDPGAAEIQPYLTWLTEEGKVISQLDQVYVTDGEEVISRTNGGYCRKHFIWCHVYRTTRTTVFQTGLREIDRFTVLADSPIAIDFIGYETGLIDLTSKGNVTLLGSLFNESGRTSVKVTDGALTQGNDSVVSAANRLELEARDGIGSVEQGLRVQVGDTLSAYSSQGDINLQAVNGGLDFTRLEAARGDVNVLAQGDITSSNGAAVTGASIGLVSTHGSIGSASELLNINTGSNERALFSAEAVGGVFVEETNGDLWIDTIRAGGDVHVKVRNGDLLDGNANVTYEERSLDQLRELWEGMGLTGAKADEALLLQKESLVRAGNQRYARYWQMRNARLDNGSWVADSYNPAQADFSADQVAQMRALGWSDARIAEAQAQQQTEYAKWNAEFGGATYASAYEYELSATELTALESTSHWTEDELRYSVSASLLNRGSGGSGRIEGMNVEGRNVTLEANKIGRLLDEDVVIDLSQGPVSLTPAQRAALASAEYDDIYFDDDTNPTLIRIVQRDDVNIRATGDIRATALGDVYLGGDRDFNIYDVNGHTVHIKTDGSISSANGTNVVVRGHDVVLEAAGGTIGGDPVGGDGSLHTAIDGELTARAKVVDLVNHGDLSIQRITGTDALRLRVLGNLSATTQLGENLLGGSIDLWVTGNAGDALSRIQLGTGGLADRINLDIGGNAWIGGLQGALGLPGVLRFGNVEVGGLLDIGQTTDLWQYGDWNVGGLSLDLGNLWRMQAGTSLFAGSGIYARVDGDAELGDIEAGDAGASIDIEAYRLSASHDGAQWLADDRLRLRAAGGDIGQVTRYVTLGAQRLDVASIPGSVYANLLGGIGAGSIASAGSQWLTTLGNVSLDQVRSGGGDIYLSGTGVVSIADLFAQGALDLQGQDLVLGTAESRTGDTDIVVTGSLEAGDLTVGGNWTLDAATADIGTADVVGDADQVVGTLTQQQLMVGGDWTLVADEADVVAATIQGHATQQAGRLGMDTLAVGGNWQLDGGDAVVASAQVGGSVNQDVDALTLGDLTVGGNWTLDAATADIGTADVVGDADQVVGTLTQQQLSVGGDWTLVADEADVVAATIQGHATQQAGRLGMDTLAVGGNWQLDGGDAVVASAQVGGSVNQDVDALTLGDLTVGGNWTLDAATADIGTADVVGDADQVVGTLTQQQLSVGGDWTLEANEADIVAATIQGHATQQAGRLGMDTLAVGGNWQLDGGDAVIEQATVAGDVDVTLAGDLSLGSLDASSTRITAGNASRIGRLGIDGDLLLQVANNLSLGQARVSNDAVLRHTGADGTLVYGELDIGNTLEVTGAGDWTGGTATAGADVLFDVGSANLQRLESLRGDLLLQAQRQFAAGALATPQGLIDLVAGSIDVGTADAAATLDMHVTGGPLRILHGHSGGNLTLTAATGSLAEIHFGTPADPDAVDGLSTAHLKSGADILVRTDGDLYGGNAEAEGLVTLIGRNMRLGRVQSLQGDVFLQAEQDIWGLLVEAQGDVGIVAGGNLDMPDVRFGGTYSLKAGKDLTVGIGGDLNVRGVAEAGRNLTFNVGGDVDLAAIKAGRNVLVNAGGSIHLDEGIEAGGDIDLLARRGSVSSGGLIHSSGQHDGQPTSGEIRVTAAGDVDVAGFQADAGNIDVDGRSLSIGSLLASGDIDLLGRGFIHVGSSRSGGRQDWRADEDIAFDQLLAGTQAYLDSLLDTRGRLLSAGAGAVVNAGWRSGVASEATVWIDQAFMPTLSVHSGNRIHVGDANIGQAVDLHGRDIELYGRHTGTGSLNLWVEGSGAVAAQRFDAVIDAGAILVPRLYAVDGTLRTTADLVVIEDASHVDYLRLHTANANVLMDNTTPLYQAGADVQLYELDRQFRLAQAGLVTSTNSYVVHRRFTHQVLVPNFHSPHVDTLLEFQRNSGARYGEQHLSAGFTDQRLGDLPSQLYSDGDAPEGWELTWSNLPASLRMQLSGDGSEGDTKEEERNLGAMLW